MLTQLLKWGPPWDPKEQCTRPPQGCRDLARQGRTARAWGLRSSPTPVHGKRPELP